MSKEHRVYIFLAEGFEEIEALTVVDILRRANISISMISMNADVRVTGSHGISVQADGVFSQIDYSSGTLFILPGGQPGSRNLCANEDLAALFRQMHGEGRQLAAICAAPGVLGTWGLLEGREAVCYPGVENQLTGAKVLQAPVVSSGSITTGRGMGTAIDFALALLEKLQDKACADKIAEAILYKR